mmetsp:Transcript_62544/g.150803  ORF Transcript_62544/g.150803 Transcript_62544/m.150803 type:complete len:298 (-) Transcript_62544:279-1172(-)
MPSPLASLTYGPLAPFCSQLNLVLVVEALVAAASRRRCRLLVVAPLQVGRLELRQRLKRREGHVTAQDAIDETSHRRDGELTLELRETVTLANLYRYHHRQLIHLDAKALHKLLLLLRLEPSKLHVVVAVTLGELRHRLGAFVHTRRQQGDEADRLGAAEAVCGQVVVGELDQARRRLLARNVGRRERGQRQQRRFGVLVDDATHKLLDRAHGGAASRPQLGAGEARVPPTTLAVNNGDDQDTRLRHLLILGHAEAARGLLAVLLDHCEADRLLLALLETHGHRGVPVGQLRLLAVK